MKDLYGKLIALLERKREVLAELIEKQQTFKEFLTQPRWSRFPEVTRPQEDLLVNLRQIHSAQDYLLSELSREMKIARPGNLKGLAAHLQEEQRETLLQLIGEISDAVTRLRELSRLSLALNQAEWCFNRDWLGSGGMAPVNSNVYNAQGYNHMSGNPGYGVSRQI